MHSSSETLSPSSYRKQGAKLAIMLALLLVICLFGRTAEAETSTYVFDPNQSTVVQTGGFAGVHETYPIEGQFQLSVDLDAGIASFDKVDANLTEPSGFLYTQSLGVLFNMTELAGTVVDDTAIEFRGKASDDSDILITLTLAGYSVHLTGETILPPGSADFFEYELDAVASKKYSGGTGEPNDPYRIATAEDLMALGESPEDYDKHFILTADIDLSVYAEAAFRIIGNSYSMPFRGTFDGDGHVIRNLAITDNSGKCIGLFGTLGCTGHIKNLELADARVTAHTYVGALVGYNAGGSIQNCRVTADVQGVGYTGGIAGISIGDASIHDCRADVRISGQSYETGGIAGANSGSVITRCAATGIVTGSQSSGGITGRQDGGAVLESSSTCSVTGARWTGGLVGRNAYSVVSGCFATGDVSGVDVVGGLVGFSDSEISDCWAGANVSGESSVGGLIGENVYGFVCNSYSRSVVSGRVEEGGLVGGQRGRCFYDACFWDSDIDVLPPAVPDAVGIYAKPSAEMQTAGTFLEGGWDFIDVWGIGESQTYPYLRKYSAADINQDETINFLDLAILAENWLAGF